LTASVLNIHARVARPGCFVDQVAGAALAWLTEVGFTDFFEVCKTNVFRLLSHFREDFFYRRHEYNGVTIGTVLSMFVHCIFRTGEARSESGFLRTRESLVGQALCFYQAAMPSTCN